MITTEEIKRRLWDGANELRGSMDASRYKDYMLGLMFYKFLSDKTLDTFAKMNQSENMTEEQLVSHYHEQYTILGETLEKAIITILGYSILPNYLYQVWLQDINNGTFEVQKVTDSLNHFERTISMSDAGMDFTGIFASTSIDLTDTALGSSLNTRSKNVQELIKLFADLNMVSLQNGDVLGDAYEYLIGQFAMESGAKAGEFYTPRQVSEVMAQIIAKSNKISSLYDPTVGSGSLLLTVSKHLDSDTKEQLVYYGQEKNTATYNLTRMNLILHGVRPEKMNIKNGDTLEEDWPEDPKKPAEGAHFDAVVMNPPYSVKKWNKHGLKVSDPRFEIAGVLPPDSKGDYAFLLHGLYHLHSEGTMAIVLPHGVLFRGGTEGIIRTRLLEKNYIDCIIGLPSNLFQNTGIPVSVIILKKNRNLSDPVLIIDASDTFTKMGKQNVLMEKDIARIVDVYTEKLELIGFSHLATRKEIISNEYNLNIPRYVEKISTDIPHDLDGHLLGGIPEKNILNLKMLNSLVPDILTDSLTTIRPKYKEFNSNFEDFSKAILDHKTVKDEVTSLRNDLDIYITKHLLNLKKINDINIIKEIKDHMLTEIKEILDKHKDMDKYNGYQMVAEIWTKYLDVDAELISSGEFYKLATMKEPNIVTKGTGDKRRQEQDGWEGKLIPVELIIKHLFEKESAEIDNLNISIAKLESDLSELVEDAKIEDTEIFDILNDHIKRDKEDELTDSFVRASISRDLNSVTKGTEEYNLLKKTINLIDKIANTKKEVLSLSKERQTNAENKISELTIEEIDMLIESKWFGDIKKSIEDLIHNPLKEEINILKELHERYNQTMDDIDSEIMELEKSLEIMMSQIEVQYE